MDARLLGRQGAGDTTYWSGLLHGLSQSPTGFRVLLFSNIPRPLNIPWSPEFRWVHLPSKRSRWWSLARFPIAARRMGARAIHTQYNLSPLAGKFGITTIHDVSFFVEPEWFRPMDRNMLQKFVPSSARRARFVLTVSNTSREHIERYIPGIEDKIVVTPNACNPAIVPIPREEAVAQVGRELGVDGPFLLTVGTRAPRKNMNLVAAAADRLPKEVPHSLVVSGKEGWGEEKLGLRARAVGYVTDAQLAALYSAADLYLAPSLYEGFGITILEAFTCGCPVLCSDGGAQPEVAGKAAMIMRGSDAREWAAAIVGLLKDTARLDSMRELGRRRAERFSWKDMARRTADVYREVMR
jgi:glycosyltransferase involved in cell wall biosynthesis